MLPVFCPLVISETDVSRLRTQFRFVKITTNFELLPGKGLQNKIRGVY